ncbi:LysR family transcriptional regulator [Pendulispora albinea]|uniref:LysR family transcriptional regulator n=1 Tax=Pendulispora albinea TaxID=2741071 RepID=A0ABZ2M7S0_9BACT
MDMNLIVALRALLHARNVTRAAKSVGLSQSSMSHALGRLRAHFDDALLVKVGRSMVLTELGKSLIPSVDSAVAQLERVFVRREKFDPLTAERTFHIVGTDNLELYLLPRLMALLAREAPKIDLRVHRLPDDWVSVLERGDADLKLGRKYKIAPTLRSQDLLEERLVCVVRKGHPIANKKRLTAAEYAALAHVVVAPWLALGSPAVSVVDEALLKHGLERRVVLTVPNFLVAPFVVAQNDLALTVSERLTRTFERSLKLEIIELPIRLAHYKLTQVWAERANDDDGHQWLRQTIVRALSNA